jgi:hypothetical protein
MNEITCAVCELRDWFDQREMRSDEMELVV